MKKIILSTALLITGISFGQTYKFKLVYSDGESAAEVTNVEVNVAPNKMSVRLTEEGVVEYMYADNTTKKVIELLDEDGTKEAYVSSWETDIFEEALTVSYAADLCLLPEAVKDEEYRLLAETKVIQGFNCQKVEILADGEVIGTGWLAKGVFVKFTDEIGMFLTPDGTLIECTISIDGETSTCTLVSYSKTLANPAAAFNATIPADYEVIDDSDSEGGDEDYYDDEDEGE